MQFTNLNFFSILVFIIIFIIISFLAYKKYFVQIKFNKNYELLASPKKFYIKYIFLLLSLSISLFAIFWLKYWEKKENIETKGIDMMFVLDVSKSMNVADIKDKNYAYTRLDVIKNSIENFVSSHKQDRFWLVIFAWDAISTIPLTTDHDLFLTMLSWVDYKNLTVQGSNFKKALNMGVNRFLSNNNKNKALVFISDWWDENTPLNPPLQEGDITDIAFFVVWVWTEQGWKIIKWLDAFWRPIYQKYKWNYVISKLNRKNLKEITKKLSWEYLELKKVWDLSKLNKKLNKLEKKSITKNINSTELMNYWRNLTIFSFIFFLLFIFVYLLEEKFIFIKNNNE